MANEQFKIIEEQDAVLKSHDKNIAISASAGSGKTSVMIRKIVKLITEENVKIEDILVLTYTNSASSEMKQKLINAITKSGKVEIQKELDNIVNSDISTFDSFCQKLVKKYFYLLDIDPAFNILQGSEETLIRSKAIKNAIKSYKKSNFNNFSIIFDFYGSNRTDKKIKEIVLKMNDFCRSILSYDDFKSKSLSLFEPQDNPFASQILFNSIKEQVTNQADKLKDLFNLSKSLEFEKYCIYINSILAGMDLINNSKNLAEIIDNANLIKIDRSPQKDKRDEYLLVKIKSQKERFDNIVNSVKEFQSAEEYKKSICVCKQTTLIFFDLYERFLKEYEKIKSAKNLFDYNDVERLTLKLFENPEILQTIKQKYKHIFIDEFQDANRVQEKLINQLRSENNLFLVGDLKQAIYGFRQSNAKIFENIINQFENDDKSEYLKLNCNFRTTHQILNFVNNIFSVIMTQKTANLDYKDKSMLNGQGDFEKEKYPCVELDILFKDKEEKESESKVYSVQECQNQESDDDMASANFVAERITKLLNEEIYDINTKCYRKIEYKDIAILLRSRTKQQAYIEAFNNFNIPVLENSNANLDETFDASVLINLIKVSQNFKDDVSLASVMMSNLFDFSANEMLDIRKNVVGKQNFYDCVLEYNKDDEIKRKIDYMTELLQKFAYNSTYQSLIFALNQILEETNYEYKIQNSFNGLSRAKNVKDFVNSFTNSNYNYSVTEYLNFIRENVREQKVVGAITSNNVVNITTMHSSKGLEWPVVIIPELSASFNTNSQEPEIVLNEEIGVGLKYYNQELRQKSNSVFYSVVKTFNKIDNISERLRLLYVALTRPKNRLILIGQTNKLEYEKFENDWQIMNSNNYLTQIVNSLSNEDISKINARVCSFNLMNSKDYTCNVIDQKDYQSINDINNTNILNKQYEEKEIKDLANYIQTGYFNDKATLIAEKNSVSSILKADDEFASKNFEPNKLLTSEDKYQGIQKNELGSLYHKIMELYDFNDVVNIQNIKTIIKKIKEQNIFDEQTINAINFDIVIKNLKLLKELCKDSTTLKEQTFVMQVPYSEIEDSDINDKVLVQGVCDLIIIKNNKTILVDYKFSNLNESSLINKYYKQLLLYKKSATYALGRQIDECYILSLKPCELIKVDVK